MLTVKRRNVEGRKDVLIDYFANITEVFDYFKNFYGGAYKLELRFSHDPFEFYRKTFTWNNSIVTSARGWGEVPEFCYTITNDAGIRYSRETILGYFRKIRKDRKLGIYRNYFLGFKRHRRGSYHRRPDTFQERKMSVNVIEEEGEPKWRLSRNMRNLPTTYDDLQHYDVRINNWKRYRKTQWK